MYQCHEAIVTPVDSVTRTGLRVQAVDKQPSSRTFYLRGDRRLTLPETLASSSDKVTNVVGQTILIVVAVIVSVHIFRVECEISIVGLGLAGLACPEKARALTAFWKFFLKILEGFSHRLFYFFIIYITYFWQWIILFLSFPGMNSTYRINYRISIYCEWNRKFLRFTFIVKLQRVDLVQLKIIKESLASW